MPDADVGLPPIGQPGKEIIPKSKKTKDKKADKKAVGPMAEMEAAMKSIAGGAKTAAAIARIQDQQDDYSRKTDQEQKRLHELTVEVKKLERTLLEEKVQMGGINAQKHAEEAIGKQVKNLEKRLDKARVKYNDAVAYNKRLCEEIETARYELTAGQAAIKEQQKLVQARQEELREMAEHMQECYVRRDQAHAGVQALKADAARAEIEFRQDWDTMKTVLAEDAKRQHEAARKVLRQGKHTIAEDKAAKEVVALGHGIQQGRWAAANAQAAESAAINKTKDMKAALDRIFKATNMPDVESLCAAFQERQESEMRQLLLTQEMEDQMHKTQEEIMEFKIAIEEVHGRGRAAEAGRKKMEDMLQDRLSDIEKKIADCDEELAKSAEVEERIIKKVRELHILLGGQPPRDEPDEEGMVSETVDIRWTVKSLSLLIEPKITALCKRFATLEGSSAPATAQPAVAIETDYDRMVEQAKAAVAAGGPDASIAKLWLADDMDSSEEEEADQSTRWTLHIQPPSIRGVQIDSDDEDDDSPLGGVIGGSPDRGVFLSREAIKKKTAQLAARAAKGTASADEED